ncbi:hypothetical protein E2C01_086039 [Portunus trituberculatus]|uniref:Uncharacterized protein n=1 Tax=Portunus trituberculatus TaxID=210409 RepID=A0A5B7J881_PORTR|nr:hypothetical protein [Portunus trituberculatus]
MGGGDRGIAASGLRIAADPWLQVSHRMVIALPCTAAAARLCHSLPEMRANMYTAS